MFQRRAYLRWIVDDGQLTSIAPCSRDFFFHINSRGNAIRQGLINNKICDGEAIRRQREALNEALEALSRALNAQLPELTAEDLRLSARAIGSITGRIDVEDLLDVIFNDFCIGK